MEIIDQEQRKGARVEKEKSIIRTKKEIIRNEIVLSETKIGAK